MGRSGPMAHGGWCCAGRRIWPQAVRAAAAAERDRAAARCRPDRVRLLAPRPGWAGQHLERQGAAVVGAAADRVPEGRPPALAGHRASPRRSGRQRVIQQRRAAGGRHPSRSLTGIFTCDTPRLASITQHAERIPDLVGAAAQRGTAGPAYAGRAGPDARALIARAPAAVGPTGRRPDPAQGRSVAWRVRAGPNGDRGAAGGARDRARGGPASAARAAAGAAVTLPLAAERDPERVLQYEMDRLTPFAADELFWAWGIERRDRARGQLHLRLRSCRRRSWMRRWTCCGRPACGRRRSRRLSQADYAGIALDGPIGAVAPARPGARGRCLRGSGGRRDGVAVRAAVRKAPRSSAISPPAAPCRPGGGAAAAVRQQRRRHRRVRRPAGPGWRSLGMLATLTDVLPDDTFLTELALRAGVLTISGQSAAAARLISALAADPASAIRPSPRRSPATRARAATVSPSAPRSRRDRVAADRPAGPGAGRGAAAVVLAAAWAAVAAPLLDWHADRAKRWSSAPRWPGAWRRSPPDCRGCSARRLRRQPAARSRRSSRWQPTPSRAPTLQQAMQDMAAGRRDPVQYRGSAGPDRGGLPADRRAGGVVGTPGRCWWSCCAPWTRPRRRCSWTTCRCGARRFVAPGRRRSTRPSPCWGSARHDAAEALFGLHRAGDFACRTVA